MTHSQVVVAKDTWQNGAWALGQPGAATFAAADLSTYGLAVLTFSVGTAGVLDSLSVSVLVPSNFDWPGATYDFVLGRGATQLYAHPLDFHARYTDLRPVNSGFATPVEVFGGQTRHNLVFDLQAKGFTVEAGETIGIGFAIGHSTQAGTRRVSLANPATIPTGTVIDSFVRKTVNDHIAQSNVAWGFASPCFAFRASIFTGGGTTVEGKVVFGDWFGPPIGSVLVEFQNLARVVVASRTALLAPDGSFSVLAPPPGSYYLSAKHAHWLRRTTGPHTLPGSTNWGTLPLVNGDIDQDNEVAIGDYAALSSTFGTSGPLGDLDGDGDVGIGDFAILSANFGMVGDD